MRAFIAKPSTAKKAVPRTASPWQRGQQMPRLVSSTLKSSHRPFNFHDVSIFSSRELFTQAKDEAGTVRLPIQASLKVGAVDDPLEHEADRIAEQVTRTPLTGAASSNRKKEASGHSSLEHERTCTDPTCPCHKAAGAAVRQRLTRSAVAGGTQDVGYDLAASVRGLDGGGHVLPHAVRQNLELRLQEDLSGVRIHHDTNAAHLAGEFGAHAFTTGRHVVFGAGQYSPDSPKGQRLLAHEITHVVQQRGSIRSQRSSANLLQRSPADVTALQKKYNITIEKGDKDWSDEDIKHLQAALKRLSGKEAKVLNDYHFIRWTSKDTRVKKDPSYKDPGISECGLREADLATQIFKISMYDECFVDPEARKGTNVKFGIPTGEFNILHEIGHAADGDLERETWKAFKKAEKDSNKGTDDFNAASLRNQRKMTPKLARLDKTRDAERVKYDASAHHNDDKFKDLTKGKDSLTNYSESSTTEAIAEAFAIYKADPNQLKKSNLKLFNWFKNHQEITGAK